ncbi:MAG: hypothetical protein EHJ95_01200 [Methanobacteriota archaeon]|nr:MAG: hypothetical protein EHJ95_01200 [Euryarchaeota archaeon]
MADPIAQPSQVSPLQFQIERYYVMANEGRNAVRIWLMRKTGPHTEPFDLFYHGFIALFDMTKGLKEIEKGNGDLLKQIESWADYRNEPAPGSKPDLRRMCDGMDFLDKYTKILQDNKLIAYRKVA